MYVSMKVVSLNFTKQRCLEIRNGKPIIYKPPFYILKHGMLFQNSIFRVHSTENLLLWNAIVLAKEICTLLLLFLTNRQNLQTK